MKKIFMLLCISAVAIFAKPQVSVSIIPTKYFVEQIAGDTVDVNVMVGAGADPHTYEPKPKQMTELEKSEIYFAVGIEFEDVWLEKFKQNYPKMQVVPTQDGIELIKMVEHGHSHDGHAHGPHCDHHHGEFDPHIWLDPVIVKTQAANIAKALSEKYPANKELYAKNLAKFETNLDALDKEISQKLSSIKNRKFMVYHPSWGYFAKRYNLEQIAIEAGGKEPKPAQLAELINEAKEHDIKVVFVAPNFSKKAAQTIAAQAGAQVVEVDQLPLKWEESMRQMTEILAKSN
ncbi:MULTISPECIES: metal ABC transporter solute-binding protein, Zn/Mn family [unclassified Campylobacter]|uniref:metal ABC transporter solute-binding protein, Zn/Mn family n=1 Tax=unclassified Campylobacter TaxID=2593542 RepID=UPI003D3383D8